MASERRGFLGLTWPDLAVLAAYVATVCLALSRYLPWEDEGRAWTAVRFFGLYDLVFHALRYEGHPPVWYLILFPLAKLHFPFATINLVSAGFGLAGIYVLLRYSPFPSYIRWLLPFGFALAYQYAVVARSYSLFPLLGFLIAMEYRSAVRKPVRMAILLALLANLTVHGTIVACGFGLSYAWDLYRERRLAGGHALPVPQVRLAAGIFAVSLAFVLVVLWPARDLKAPVSHPLDQLIHRVAPAAYEPLAHPAVVLRTAADAESPGPEMAAPEADKAPTPLALNLGMGSLKIRDRLRTVFLYPIATFAPLAILFQVLVFAMAWQRGKPLLIVVPLVLGAFIVEVYLRLWHTSLIWVVLIMILWVLWDERETPTRRSLQNVTAVVFALVCLLQIPWTVAAVRFVRTHSTYPAQATADYLKSLPANRRIDGFDHAFTLLPYFQLYPFHLQLEVLEVPTVLADHPDVIVFRDTTVTPEQLAQLGQAGYRSTQTFCGTPFFPNQPLTPLCMDVLEKR